MILSDTFWTWFRLSSFSHADHQFFRPQGSCRKEVSFPKKTNKQTNKQKYDYQLFSPKFVDMSRRQIKYIYMGQTPYLTRAFDPIKFDWYYLKRLRLSLTPGQLKTDFGSNGDLHMSQVKSIIKGLKAPFCLTLKTTEQDRFCCLFGVAV